MKSIYPEKKLGRVESFPLFQVRKSYFNDIIILLLPNYLKIINFFNIVF